MSIRRAPFAAPCVLFCLLAAGGCLDRDVRPLVPCTLTGVSDDIDIDRIDKVDLLFVVDNSGSMSEEQASLAVQIPRLVNVLASGDSDGDGAPNFPAVPSLHVGVITTDMGTGGFRVPTCDEPNFGDDGLLQTTGRTDITGCMASYPHVLTFELASGADPAAFANDVTCVAQRGTGGCGFEQQLDATLKALVPSTSGTTFAMSSVGHGDRENTGFLRADSVLVVIMLTDEEDCSAADPSLFDPMSSTYTGDLNLRCFMYPGAVHPVERFSSALLALRPQTPDHLIFAAITGIPPHLSTPEGTNFDEILASDELRERPDPTSMTPRLVPSCNVPGLGIAFPPRRIVTVAKQLHQAGANGIVQSICQADFTPALNVVINQLERILNGTCLPRALPRDPSGEVKCNIVEVLPLEGDITRCADLPGAAPDPLRLEADGREVCSMQQLIATGTVPSGLGWYYDDFTPEVATTCPRSPQRIAFTDAARPPNGVNLRLECLQAGGGMIAGEDGMPVVCASNADCPSSFVCDVEGAHGPPATCINPTCGI